jgi:predicted murein hydrolase (TIGR00659 family)
MTPLNRASDIWVYLSANPLFWLTAVLAAYLLADWISAKAHRHPLVNTVAIAAVLLGTLLLATHTPFQTFFDGAQFVHFLLGPATVALAIPLYRNIGRVKAMLVPMLTALFVGSLTAVVSVVLVAGALGAPLAVLASLAPKSATTPIAMSLAGAFGGIPTLTAAFTLITGLFGAIMVTPLMNALRIKDFAARGFAAGLAAHGLGTARAFQVDATAGAFAGIALGLNGAMTAIVVPLVLPHLLHLFAGHALGVSVR